MEGATRFGALARRQDACHFARGVSREISMSLWVSSPPGRRATTIRPRRLEDTTSRERRSCDFRRMARTCWHGCGALPAVKRPGSGRSRLPGGEPRERAAALSGPGARPRSSAGCRTIATSSSCDPMARPPARICGWPTPPRRFRPLTATRWQRGAPGCLARRTHDRVQLRATDFDLVEVPLDGSPLRPFLSSTRNEFDPAASPVDHTVCVRHRPHRHLADLAAERGRLPSAAARDRDRFRRGELDGGRVAGVFSRRQASGVSAVQWQAAEHCWRIAALDHVGGGWHARAAWQRAELPGRTDWSPDGEWIAYVSGQCRRMVAVEGAAGAVPRP